MSMMDTAKLLVRWGALLAIILGIVEVALSALSFIGWWWFGFTGIIGVALGIVAIICGFLVQTTYLPQMNTNPKGVAIYLIILGILAMFGAYGIGGLLILIGGIIVLVEK